MSLFQKIFKNKPDAKESEKVKYVNSFFQTLTAYTPVFRNFSGGVYESELCKIAINAKARHISKLVPVITGSAQPILRRKLTVAPNEWQTWGQFLARVSTILDVQNNSFIVPVYNEFGEMTGIFPVLPSRCTLVEYNDTLYLKYEFSSGVTGAIEFDNCGLLTKYQYADDMFGDNNASMNPTLQLIDIQNQGIREGVKSSATFRFMAQASNFTDDEDLEEERKKFTKTYLEQSDGEGGGFLLFPNTYTNIKQIDSKPFVIDAEQTELIQKNVFMHFGTNEDIILNKAVGDAWAAFYEGEIEPFIIQLGDVLTRMIFKGKELVNNRVTFTANRLQYMTTTEKLTASTELSDRGVLTLNQVLEIWNLPPVEGGDVRIIRGEYKNAEDHLNGEKNNEQQKEENKT
ncbi:MAG: phage portal protein [Acutalibacteraceae bacterium]